jgi:spore coat protein H
MQNRVLSLALVICAAVISSAAVGAPGDELLELTRVYPIHLTVAADDYGAMDPPPKAGMFGPPSIAGRPGPGDPDFGAGNLEYEFEYVGAELQVGEQAFPKVGLRYKGSGTYLVSQRQAKRSFKIDFDRYDSDATWDGLKKLSLNSGVMDASKAREALAYRVFRAAGVPAPRTAFAEVTLTVPGKFGKEYLGLYTVVEQVDTQFLKAHFGNGKGLLLKPEGIGGLPHFGEDPAAYHATYNAKSKPGRGDWNRLVEFTRLVNRADDAEFNQRIGEYLDIDGFVRYLAVNTLLSSLDGFIGMGHNYYLYLSPETGKFTFIPWDLDLAFGAFAIYGSAEQVAELSVDHPHLGENKLIDRLLAMPEVKAAYREQVRKLVTEEFATEKLTNELAAIEQLTSRTEGLEKKAATGRKEGAGGFGPMGGIFGGMPVGTFIEKRAASVDAQLKGEKTGYVPQMMAFGPPGGFGMGGPRGGARFDALDAHKNGRIEEAEFVAGVKKFFVEWDRDKNGALNQQELGDGMRELAPAGFPR